MLIDLYIADAYILVIRSVCIHRERVPAQRVRQLILTKYFTHSPLIATVNTIRPRCVMKYSMLDWDSHYSGCNFPPLWQVNLKDLLELIQVKQPLTSSQYQVAPAGTICLFQYILYNADLYHSHASDIYIPAFPAISLPSYSGIFHQACNLLLDLLVGQS